MGEPNETYIEVDGKISDLRQRIKQIVSPFYQSPRGRIVITGAAYIAYAVVYLLMDRHLGPGTGILALVPVATAGWLLGQRAGLIVALLILPLHVVLLAILGQALSFIYQLPFIVINFSVLLIGVIIGKLSDLVGQLRSDLIRRLRGEMEFWGSEERYQALDTAFTGVLIVDSEEKILYGNLTFADMLGQVPDNLLGVPLEIILESDQYSKFQEHQNLMKKGIA